ncbi:MAG: HD domain-containing protein [Armatimonadota bacterium]
MIQLETLERCHAWFDRFTGQFSSDEPLVAANLQGKFDHTHCVVRNARALAAALGRNEEGCAFAEILGLFHDVGRFPQLENHATFRDGSSFDHAAMSVQVLEEEGVSQFFSEREWEILSTAIRHHNKYAISEECTGEALFYSRLLRDADKLDALKKAAAGHLFTLLNLDGTGAVSPAVMEAILAGRCARYTDIQTQPDIILAIVALVYDINFPRTFAIVREERYLQRIFERLPQNEEFAKMREAAQAFLDRQA